MAKVENFPSNSDKSRELKPVTQGVRVQKKTGFIASVSDTLFGENTRSVGQYILFDILIPAAKDTITDMITKGIEMIVYGDRGSRSSRRSGPSRTSYGSYYRDRDRREDRYSRTTRSGHRLDDIIIASRADAEEVLEQLFIRLDDYGTATVADFYDLVGITGEWTDRKWGWDTLERSDIRPVRGGYVVVLPKPIALD